ncbi:MAG: Flp pilus assembly complex ATPase component TadA [Candidatus Omnitrophica bacterium]|nr:Flp pilus assembly complex ATPase component TadA [Candidatus Omnitrophota bacterium]
MGEATPQLNVQALAEAFAQVGRSGVGAEGATKDSAALLELASQTPVVRLVDAVLFEAVNRRASDIHIEAFERDVVIRYRIDGQCYEVAKPPKTLALAIASRIKILSNLDVAESRLPQDGRILLTVNHRQIDLRVSTLPTMHGESIVLRVLDKSALDKTLTQLGMASEMQQTMERLIQRPNGLLLVTGPTGSGKTTTLYACLAGLNRPEVKLITTEDPVEYDLNGLVQVAVNPKIDLSFAICLRAILRHDPDVIMVGEIRDRATAQVAIQAALTGHLVFSTLHTNDAPGAVTRLLDMGLEPFLVTSTIVGVLAQRLIRALCPQCRAPYEPTVEERATLHLPAGDAAKRLMSAVGCEACQGIGFKGRTGAFELLVMSEELRPLILERASASDIQAKARAEGMRTLREDGIAKVLAGETTVAEMMRETQDYA